VTSAIEARRAPGEAARVVRTTSRPSGTAMKPSIAKKCEATQAPDPIDASAPAAVVSSCHGRTAG
jgi:hypothetical protein